MVALRADRRVFPYSIQKRAARVWTSFTRWQQFRARFEQIAWKKHADISLKY